MVQGNVGRGRKGRVLCSIITPITFWNSTARDYQAWPRNVIPMAEAWPIPEFVRQDHHCTDECWSQLMEYFKVHFYLSYISYLKLH
jgi:hypothetical protein